MTDCTLNLTVPLFPTRKNKNVQALHILFGFIASQPIVVFISDRQRGNGPLLFV
jgi:hypothetical protein